VKNMGNRVSSGAGLFILLLFSSSSNDDSDGEDGTGPTNERPTTKTNVSPYRSALYLPLRKGIKGTHKGTKTRGTSPLNLLVGPA
jgi:hypothetical protein